MTNVVQRNPFVMAGVIFILAITLVGIFAPLVAPHRPTEINMLDRMLAPGENSAYPLGTDIVGRDILSRIIFSFRVPVVLGAIGVLLGTIGSLVLVWLGATDNAFKTSGRLPARGFLDCSLLRLAGLTLPLSILPMFFVNPILGASLSSVGVVVSPLSAILPLSLIYWSIRKALTFPATPEHSLATDGISALSTMPLALRQSLILAPTTYSLAFLMSMFMETPASLVGLGLSRGHLSLGIMVLEGRSVILDASWSSLLPIAVVAIGVGAFLAIVLPIRRIQKQAEAAREPESVGINTAGLWPRIASITIDALIFFSLATIVGALIVIIAPPDFFAVLLMPIEIVYVSLFVGGYKNSVGHRLFKLKVVRSDGTKVGIGLSCIRGLLVLSLQVIGILAIPFSRRRRALYDMLTDTFVVKQDRTKSAPNLVGGVVG